MIRIFCFVIVFICLRASGQNAWKEKNLFLLGGVEVGATIYNNEAASVFNICSSAKMFVSGFTFSTRYYSSPLTDFGPLHMLFIGIAYCSPLRYPVSGFFELGYSFTSEGKLDSHRSYYDSEGPNLIAGLNYRVVPEGRLLATASVRAFPWGITFTRGKTNGIALMASAGLVFRII